MSDNENSWPDTWPNRASDWDGEWNGQYGKYVRADQESYFVVDDYYNSEFEFWPDENDIPQDTTAAPDNHRRGLGIQLDVRGYQWNHPAAEDIIIVTYWITNVGSNTLDSVVFGMYGDADIGGSSDFNDDDAWFDTENDMVFQWDNNNWSSSYGGFQPAYFGWSFLESPGNPHDGIDNDGDGEIDENCTFTVTEGESLAGALHGLREVRAEVLLPHGDGHVPHALQGPAPQRVHLLLVEHHELGH